MREFVRSLRLPPTARAKREEMLAYGALHGLDALKRQLDLAERLYRCCWMERSGPHHPAYARPEK